MHVFKEGTCHGDTLADLANYLGTEIAIKHTHGIAGTKSLYLTVSNSSSVDTEPSIVTLACRCATIHFRKKGWNHTSAAI